MAFLGGWGGATLRANDRGAPPLAFVLPVALVLAHKNSERFLTHLKYRAFLRLLVFLENVTKREFFGPRQVILVQHGFKVGFV